MRVLVLGATGNLGSRLLPALILRGHTVFAFVRNPSKLSHEIRDQLAGIERGDARKAADIKRAANRNQCDAIVNTAGYAAMAPWNKSDLPTIVNAVVCAALELGQERGHPLRVWFLGGQGLLHIPTTKYMIVDYMRIFPEHRQTWDKLRTLPLPSMNWSILCPGVMHALSRDVNLPAIDASSCKLQGKADFPPDWSPKFLCAPFGGYLNIMSQAWAYGTSLEDNAAFIAKDLLTGHQSEWLYQKVGVKERR